VPAQGLGKVGKNLSYVSVVDCCYSPGFFGTGSVGFSFSSFCFSQYIHTFVLFLLFLVLSYFPHPICHLHIHLRDIWEWLDGENVAGVPDLAMKQKNHEMIAHVSAL
jgi:hypothetical protein